MVYNYTKPRGPIAAMYTSPGPAAYGTKPLVGRDDHDPRSVHRKREAWSMGKKINQDPPNKSPGPVYHPHCDLTNKGMKESPRYSMYGRPKDLKRYSNPSPDKYSPDKGLPATTPRAPAYTFGDRTNLRKQDNVPAPNTYSLPPIVGARTVEADKKQSPAYTLKSRNNVGRFDEDLSKSPGPSAYPGIAPSVYKKRSPGYSMLGRTSLPVDHTIKPGPGAHNVDNLYAVKKQTPRFSLGIRHSDYKMPLLDPIATAD